MPKSTKLAVAVNILVYTVRQHDERVTTTEIADKLNDHPTRIRQIVSALVKGGILNTTRGTGGGIALTRPAAEIDLRQVYEAVEYTSPILLSNKSLGGRERIANNKIDMIYDQLEQKLLRDLSSYSLAYFVEG